MTNVLFVLSTSIINWSKVQSEASQKGVLVQSVSTLQHGQVPSMKSVAIASTLVVAAQGVVLHTWTWGVSYGCFGGFR